jgi:hypothetical protein
MEATQNKNVSEISVPFKDNEDEDICMEVAGFLFLASRLFKRMG